MEVVPRFFRFPSESAFVFGPRGSGKSTWLRHSLPDALWLNLLQPETYREMTARPERLRQLVEASNQRDVVIDEIQRVPELLNVVHDVIESDSSRRFLLTGSSARKLRRGGVDLLAGRALNLTMHPFMAAEVPSFDLDRAIEIGMLPLVVSSSDPVATLHAYATLYLDEEVKLEGWARDIGRFARFLETVTFSHGAVLNVANVAREVQAERNTISAYIEVLEDLLLAFRLPVFTRRAKRETTQQPKFYLFDAGVFRSLRPRGPLDRPSEIGGAALEGLVAQHLRAWIAYSSGDTKLFFWRTRAGVEVDFIVYGDLGFMAIEVQNSQTVRSSDLRPLRAFIADYPEAKALLLYRGKEELMIGGIRCVPVDTFLRGLTPIAKAVAPSG
ncbi:MAG TPA: AAA family ATPase [Thermoanaerobaculia bacterium]|jgi:predicted AAA+ superfamily ATPase|nr:AAA family ATPase [Thermoanaerobaculia bacterium]